MLTKEDKSALLHQMMEDVAADDRAYDLDGTPTLTVKLPDGTFRKKPGPNTAFYPSYAYMGARDAIFGFTPEDPQEWSHAEIPAKDLDGVFPLMLYDINAWAERRYKPSGEPLERLRTLKSVPDLIDLIFGLEVEARKITQAQDDTALLAHPNFGMF